MKCLCKDVAELEGNDALDNAEYHLKTILIDEDNWQTTYECPITSIRWLEEYPQGEYHGGGGPHLRKLSIKPET